MATVYIQKQNVDVIDLINNTGADLEQNELTVIGGKVCIANEAIASAARGEFTVEDNLLIQVDDLVSDEDTFGTADAAVYFDPSSGDFSDTLTDGYYKIGIVNTVKDSNGIVLVTLNKNAELISTQTATNTAAIGSLQAEPRILVQKITADASAGIVVTGLSEGDEVVGMSVICTATNANGTLVLEDGAGDDITDGVACATDKAVNYAATIDDSKSTIPASGAKIISVGGTAADTRGIVIITYIPA